ncbi:MAG: hypothetical protein M1828_000443 [Chrysothrix sp. TS-e1954]|nr:MAG: hypothetical protein M1828_000443 [Chrysothrix sp. TS-e1954]
MLPQEKLRIGYVPEHFATPLHFAYTKFGLSEHVTLQSFPSGTGTMIEAFKESRIDVAIGLTEAWVAGLAKAGALHPPQNAQQMPYHILSAYTLSPLRWALSTGAERNDIPSVEGLKGKKVGISRYGRYVVLYSSILDPKILAEMIFSGSHIMALVLADQKGWLSRPEDPPFEFVVCGPFASLRQAVNDSSADFFMWEHFTTKRYWGNGELKRIGEISTPWNAWHIAVRGHGETDSRVSEQIIPALRRGCKLFNNSRSEAADYITANMEYDLEDFHEWYDEVSFPDELGSPNQQGLEAAVRSLKKAGVIENSLDVSWTSLLGARSS